VTFTQILEISGFWTLSNGKYGEELGREENRRWIVSIVLQKVRHRFD
jgi:hypothetical protein